MVGKGPLDFLGSVAGQSFETLSSRREIFCGLSLHVISSMLEVSTPHRVDDPERWLAFQSNPS